MFEPQAEVDTFVDNYKYVKATSPKVFFMGYREYMCVVFLCPGM